MNSELQPGLTHTEQAMADASNTAIAFQSGEVEVYATPAMIALMEKAANNCVATYLEDGMVTVGTEINVKHFKATLPGQAVWASAELMEVVGRKLVFNIKAWDEKGETGQGTHVRYMVKKEGFGR